MTVQHRASSGSRASHRANSSVVSTKDFDPAHEAWRPALIAFCERDELPARAAALKLGKPFDYLDMRLIEALQAVLKVAP